jgi:hypothetical protein
VPPQLSPRSAPSFSLPSHGSTSQGSHRRGFRRPVRAAAEDELGWLSSLPFFSDGLWHQRAHGNAQHPLCPRSAPSFSLSLATVLPPKAAINVDGSAVEEMTPSSPPETAGGHRWLCGGGYGALLSSRGGWRCRGRPGFPPLSLMRQHD